MHYNHRMGVTDGSVDVDELMEDFYLFIEKFEAREHALKVLETGVVDPLEDENVRRLWRDKRPRYIRELQQSADSLLLVANKLIVLGTTLKADTSSLEKLTKQLAYRPYNEKPPIPPTDNEVQEAIDCAERIRAASHLSPTQVDGTSSQPDSVETKLAKLTERQRDFLKAAFQLNALDASNPKLGKEILRQVDPQLDHNNYKKLLSLLTKSGYFHTAARGSGYYLSEIGKKCASRL